MCKNDTAEFSHEFLLPNVASLGWHFRTFHDDQSVDHFLGEVEGTG